eukprot:2451522-Rhodomonas_salina.2
MVVCDRRSRGCRGLGGIAALAQLCLLLTALAPANSLPKLAQTIAPPTQNRPSHTFGRERPWGNELKLRAAAVLDPLRGGGIFNMTAAERRKQFQVPILAS